MSARHRSYTVFVQANRPRVEKQLKGNNTNMLSKCEKRFKICRLRGTYTILPRVKDVWNVYGLLNYRLLRPAKRFVFGAAIRELWLLPSSDTVFLPLKTTQNDYGDV